MQFRLSPAFSTFYFLPSTLYFFGLGRKNPSPIFENGLSLWLPFLAQQIAAGKEFILSHDPAKATGFFARQIAFLRDNGYVFVQDKWVWKAVKQ